jgi:hypothetical protein
VGLQGLHGCLLTVLDELPGKGGFGIGYKDHFESGNFREGDINTVAIVASTCGSDGRASIRFYKCVFAGNVKLPAVSMVCDTQNGFAGHSLPRH